jgi:hypothetical protein
VEREVEERGEPERNLYFVNPLRVSNYAQNDEYEDIVAKIQIEDRHSNLQMVPQFMTWYNLLENQREVLRKGYCYEHY